MFSFQKVALEGRAGDIEIQKKESTKEWATGIPSSPPTDFFLGLLGVLLESRTTASGELVVSARKVKGQQNPMQADRADRLTTEPSYT